MRRASAWWVIAWLLLAVGQRALGGLSAFPGPLPLSLLKARAAGATRAVRVNLEKVRDGLRLTWISGTGMRFQLQSSNEWPAWRKVGVVREGTGGSDSVMIPVGGPRYYRVVRVDSPKLSVPVCGENFYQRAPSNYWRLFQKEFPNGSGFIGPRNISRQPGQAPGLRRLDRPNRSSRLYWLNEATRVR